MAGVLYKSPCALLLGVDDDYPQYGRLIEIIIVNSSCIMFNVCVKKTVSFLSHYSAYCLSSSSSIHRVIPLLELHSPFPIHIYHIVCSGIREQVVVPKWHVSGCLY